MLRIIFISLCLLCSHGLAMPPLPPLNEFERLQLKELEGDTRSNAGLAPQQLLKLAGLYMRDQEQEKGLKSFLKALENAPKIVGYTPCVEEEAIYQAALQSYLETQGADARKAQKHILEQYTAISEQNPDFRRLRFIVAAAYANQGDFPRAFELFYAAYMHLPNHYLAHKIVATLHLKLLEKLPPGQEREGLRETAIFHLKAALASCDSKQGEADPTLYKLLLLCIPENDKAQAVAWVLVHIVENEVRIPRQDLAFYIEQGFHFHQLQPLKLFIDKASRWFPVSRTLLEASKKLNTTMGPSC